MKHGTGSISPLTPRPAKASLPLISAETLSSAASLTTKIHFLFQLKLLFSLHGSQNSKIHFCYPCRGAMNAVSGMSSQEMCKLSPRLMTQCPVMVRVLQAHSGLDLSLSFLFDCFVRKWTKEARSEQRPINHPSLKEEAGEWQLLLLRSNRAKNRQI